MYTWKSHNESDAIFSNTSFHHFQSFIFGIRETYIPCLQFRVLLVQDLLQEINFRDRYFFLHKVFYQNNYFVILSYQK